MPLIGVRPFSSPRRFSVEGGVTIGMRPRLRHLRRRIVIAPTTSVRGSRARVARRMGRRRQLSWAAAIAPVAAVPVLIAPWAIDTGISGGEVIRNVRLAEQDMGGLAASDPPEHVPPLHESTRTR